jgi:multiple antibiotic resistance protein
VQQTPAEVEEAGHRQAIGVVPLGLPLLAGPGSISTVIIEMQRPAPTGVAPWMHAALVLLGITLICAVAWLSLAVAGPIGRALGHTGLKILNRLFGLLLAAIAVETLAAGLRGLLPGLAR